MRRRSGGEPPHEAAWAAATNDATDAQALAVASAAYEHAQFDTAADALSRARESSIDDVAALAGYNLGVVLGDLGRSDDAVEVNDEVVARFGEATEPALREQVAKALVNKGVTLGALGRSDDELDAHDEVVARYGEATEPVLRQAVAMARTALSQRT